MEILQSILNQLNGIGWILITGMSVLVLALAMFYRQNKRMRKEAVKMKKIQQDLRVLVTASMGMG